MTIGLKTLALACISVLAFLAPQSGQAQNTVMAENPEPSAITLVKDGEAQCTIVLGSKPSRMAVMAAAELQWHIEQITGTKVPVVRQGAESTGLPIYIGESDKVRELGLKNHAFAPREFTVTFHADGIVLTGREDGSEPAPDGDLKLEIAPFDMGPNRGPLFATYEFIENFLGVRWYAPGNGNISWPEKTTTLSVTPKTIRRVPAIYDRNVPYCAGGININAWGVPAPSEEEKRMYLIRNKAAQGNLIGHAFEGWPERFDQTSSPLFEAYHPEYFSKDQGIGQLCFTSTGTLNQAITDARRWADGKGITHRACVGEDFYGLEPRDTEVRCSCDTCAPLLGKKGDFNSDEASVIVWSFADKVARALQESHPGKSVGLLAYGNHAGCPTQLDLATNIYVGMAIFQRGIPDLSNADYQMYKTWLGKLPGRLSSIWLYPCFPRETAATVGYTAFPKFEARGLNAQMRMFAEDKVRCFMFCGFYDTVLDDWCAMKFQDNPFIDVEATISEFFVRYYGPASGPMKAFYDGVEEASVGADLRSEASWDVTGTDERMELWQELMNEAEALAVDEPVKSRVANVRDHLWAEMLKGKKVWNHRKKYQADADAFQKLPPMETNAVKLAVAPTDGDAKNVDWSAVTPVKIYRNMVGFPSEKRTADFYIAHDGVNVYVRLTDHVDWSQLKGSDGAWFGDRWELFFSKQSNRNAGKDLLARQAGEWGPYRQVGARPNGARLDMWTSEKEDGESWPKVDLKYHSEKTAEGWTFCFTVPMANFSAAGPVKPGDMIYFNAIGPSEVSGEVLALSPNLNPSAYHNVPRLAGFRLDE